MALNTSRDGALITSLGIPNFSESLDDVWRNRDVQKEEAFMHQVDRDLFPALALLTCAEPASLGLLPPPGMQNQTQSPASDEP